MKAVIIAGGRGERLRPLTNALPKPMLEVGNKPILQHITELLKKYDIKEFIFIIGYLPKKITTYFEDGSKFGVKINYVFEDQKNPLGTAGSLSLVKKQINSTFIVTYADILRHLNIKEMIENHWKNKAFATINTYRRFGSDPKSMILFDENKRIQKFIERPAAKNIQQNFVWANGSFYIFEPKIFDYLPVNKNCDFGKDIFPSLIKARESVYAFPTEDLFIDIGNKEKLEQAKKLFI